MKKPEINIFVSEIISIDGVSVGQICVAYDAMMDALIETHKQITVAMSNERPIPTSILVDWCTQVEKALEKAGVEI